MLTFALASSLAIKLALPGASMVLTFHVPTWNGLRALSGAGRSVADLSQGARCEETPCALLDKPRDERCGMDDALGLLIRISAEVSPVARWANAGKLGGQVPDE